MEYLYVLAAFIFVTVVALVLKSKRTREAKIADDKERDLVMQEQVKACAEIEARKKERQVQK